MKLPVASHTFLNDWDNCPHKAYRKHIAKDLPRQPQTQAMTWGNDVHSAFEVRIKHGTAFPQGMEKFEAIAAPLVAAGARAEKMLGITVDGAHCDFFAKDVWLRGKIDATVFRSDPHVGNYAAAIFDWKTGKKREDKSELETHAVLLRAFDPGIIKITAHYVWLQEGEVGKPHHIGVDDLNAKLADIRSTMNTVKNCMEVEDFPKRRNPLCGWCDVLDCENNTKGR